MSGSKISLDEVITKVRGGGGDARGQEIVAAAIKLRDSCGRDRKVALRQMANEELCFQTQNRNSRCFELRDEMFKRTCEHY